MFFRQLLGYTVVSHALFFHRRCAVSSSHDAVVIANSKGGLEVAEERFVPSSHAPPTSSSSTASSAAGHASPAAKAPQRSEVGGAGATAKTPISSALARLRGPAEGDGSSCSSHHHAGPCIIGVAGASGSGKTSIAELIAARLEGQNVCSISSDNYYKSLEEGTDADEYNFDHPGAIDFDLLADHLESLRQGKDVEVPDYDFVLHRRTSKKTRIAASTTSVIIIDGIFILWAARVRAQCNLTIYCSEDLDICLARRCVHGRGLRGGEGGGGGHGTRSHGRGPRGERGGGGGHGTRSCPGWLFVCFTVVLPRHLDYCAFLLPHLSLPSLPPMPQAKARHR